MVVHIYLKRMLQVVNTFDQGQRRALLRFVTSCSRPPLLWVMTFLILFYFLISKQRVRGFKELLPNFAIRDAGSDEHRLPTSSTCVNLLKVSSTTIWRCVKSSSICYSFHDIKARKPFGTSCSRLLLQGLGLIFRKLFGCRPYYIQKLWTIAIVCYRIRQICNVWQRRYDVDQSLLIRNNRIICNIRVYETICQCWMVSSPQYHSKSSIASFCTHSFSFRLALRQKDAMCIQRQESSSYFESWRTFPIRWARANAASALAWLG